MATFGQIEESRDGVVSPGDTLVMGISRYPCDVEAFRVLVGFNLTQEAVKSKASSRSGLFPDHVARHLLVSHLLNLGYVVPSRVH